MTDAPTPVFGRTLVLASAGSGKTFQLSSRLVALLAAGAPPESILASTFTRKAAGEILERVLLRLAEAALDGTDPRFEGRAAELARSLPPGVPPQAMTPAALRDLLVVTVRGLHRLQVHTLDAFVHRAVRAFALELGLPQRWEVGDDTRGTRLRARALEEVLREEDPGVLVELVRQLHRERADRAVHRNLLAILEEVHELYRERDPGVEDLWGFEGGASRFPSVPDSRWDDHADQVAAAAALQRAELARPDRWIKPLAKLEGAIRDRDAATLVGETLWKNAMAGDPPTFHRTPLHPHLVDALQDLAADLPALVGPRWQRRMEAVGSFVPRYDARLEALRQEEGIFGFNDLVHALARGRALGRAEELYYRLDGQVRHILLDEFQDTSASQWAALAPLVDELLSGYEGERAFFVVADPKQSIYGWRGGEPRLLDHLRDRYALEGGTLHRSWRSSPVVLDFVNHVFRDLPSNPVVSGEAEAATAAAWMEGFRPHEAARPELTGHVEVITGPAEAPGHRGGVRPLLLRAAARKVRDLHQAAPGRSIGVLTRTNAVAARMMAELRELGVEASEEGGVPVADSPPVLAILALLTATDHPADRASAYLAAASPLGPTEGLDDPRRPVAVERVATRIRARLLARGYGAVVSDWADVLRGGASARDARRLDQLVELAFQWEDRATLRPSDFVAHARVARREDAGASLVRIMTIHRSKGLEFDAVVLPELGGTLAGRGGAQAVPFRTVPGGPVTRVFPGMPQSLAELFADLAPAVAQRRDAELRDALSGLYVALTRARHALYLLLPPDGSRRSEARSAAVLLRHALGVEGKADPDTCLFERGDPRWFAPLEAEREPLATSSDTDAQRALPGARIPLASSPRRRLVPRRTPSELEGGSRVPLATLLRPPPAGALERGTLVHAWMEALEWLPDDPGPSGGEPGREPGHEPGHEPGRGPGRESGREVLPHLEALLEQARRVAPSLAPAAVQELAHRFLGWLGAPEVRAMLAREAWPEGTEVQRERPFVVRDQGGVLQGVADRVLRLPDRRLVVVDWKTDRVPDDAALALRVEHYRPQMEAYMRALAGLEGVPHAAVEGRLVFLEAARAVHVTLPASPPVRPSLSLPPDPGQEPGPEG